MAVSPTDNSIESRNVILCLLVEVQLKIEKLSVHAASKKAESGTLCMHWIEGELILI